MATTPQATQNGAASFYSIEDKLAAIIYLLNTNNMTAEQIQANAVGFQPIQDKMGAILYLLAGGGGGGGSAILTGITSPTGVVTATSAPQFYWDSLNSALWINTVKDNLSWVQLI